MPTQLKVWEFLCEHGPARARDVAAYFNCSRCSAAAALRRVLAKKSAARRGRGRAYFARKTRPPVDARGKHPAIVDNLAKGRPVGLVAIAQKRGRLLVPRAKHPLDAAMRAWR
jgi:hypothetical protein